MVRPLQDTNPNGFVSGSKSKPLRGLLKRDKTLGFYAGAGWSSPVARQAHNLKAAGSNPAPATNISNIKMPYRWREDFIFAGDGSSSSCGP